MNKKIIIVIILIMFISFFAIKKYSSNEENIILGDTVIGDVDGNGKVQTKDYLKIRKHLLNMPKLTGDELKRADVNSDGKVSQKDYNMIRRIQLGLPVTVTTPKPSKTPTPTSKPTPTPTPKPTATPTPKPTATPTPKPSNPSKIHFLKTGDSDAIVIESGGHYGLVDAGLSSSVPLSYLESLGVTYLDFVILTHSHPDHYGGMIDVAKSYVNSKTTFYYREASNQVPEDQQYYSKQSSVIKTMKDRGADLQDVTGKYPKFNLGDFSFELMNTEVASSDEKNGDKQVAGMNKESIVTYVLYKNSVGTLLTGDVESQDEARLASKLSSKKVNVLKIAHHSWQSSTTMKFVKSISPSIAVVTGKYLLDDISGSAYYMQQKYNTAFYVTQKSDGAVVIDYGNNLAVSPSKAKESNLSVVEDKKVDYAKSGWRKLNNGIWIHLSDKNNPTSLEYDKWYQSGGKWYYLGLQGNMMTGWIEINYKGSPGLFYLDESGAMVTGWAQAKAIGPYNNNRESYYKSWIYSPVNDTINAWYQHSSTWANGKNWFYFDPSTGLMQKNKTLNIGGKSYTFNSSGVCTKGC